MNLYKLSVPATGQAVVMFAADEDTVRAAARFMPRHADYPVRVDVLIDTATNADAEQTYVATTGTVNLPEP